MLDKINLICDAIITVCGIIPTIISVFMLIKNTIKEKNWKLVENLAMSAMTSVEEYARENPATTSSEKLDMAMVGIKSGLTAAGIKFDDEMLEKIVAYIEQMCSWSKTVNNDEVCGFIEDIQDIEDEDDDDDDSMLG